MSRRQRLLTILAQNPAGLAGEILLTWAEAAGQYQKPN
jgi:hypothetical protein